MKDNDKDSTENDSFLGDTKGCSFAFSEDPLYVHVEWLAFYLLVLKGFIILRNNIKSN